MSDVLWIEDETSAADELPYRILDSDQALEAVNAAQQIDAVAIGTSVSKPLQLAQQLRARDEFLEILLIVQPGHASALRESLALNPLVGSHTSLVVVDKHLRDEVSQAVERAQARRRHRKTIGQAQSTLDAGSSALSRPTPQQYAATMWSGSPVAALAVLRQTHHIVSANDAATRLLDQDEIDLLGRPLEEVFAQSTAAEWQWLDEAGATSSRERVVAVETSAGDTVHLEARTIEVESQARDVLLLFLWDVSERVRFEELQADFLEAERRAREQAERASRVRQDVLATVSHDLRGPLQTLVTSAHLLEVLADGSEGSKTFEVAQTVGRASRYMRKLVDDLLDVSRIEGGKLSLDYGTACIADIISQAVDLASGPAAEQGVNIEAGPVASSLTLHCDTRRVVQMLQNLLTNAIKFSDEGGTVNLAARENGDHIRFSTTDQGPGIPADDIPLLFERFWQADQSTKTGVGLGLAIVRGIVDAHGGELVVESAPGEGSTFHVDLPRHPQAQ